MARSKKEMCKGTGHGLVTSIHPGHEIEGDCLEISKIDRGGGRKAAVLPVREESKFIPQLKYRSFNSNLRVDSSFFNKKKEQIWLTLWCLYLTDCSSTCAKLRHESIDNAGFQRVEQIHQIINGRWLKKKKKKKN